MAAKLGLTVLAAYLQTEADYVVRTKTQTMTVRVKITDVRESFGRTDFKITPLNGSGEMWVDRTSVTVEVPKEKAC